MKTLRLFTLMLVAILAFSTWAPAFAKPFDSGPAASLDLSKAPLAKLRVNNKTGGTIYISMSSNTHSYSFAASQQGKTTFQPVIQPGKYRVTVRASACTGVLHYTRTIKGGTVTLPAFICRKK